MERQYSNQAHGQESSPDRDHMLALPHARSSEPESANRNLSPRTPQRGQNSYESVRYHGYGTGHQQTAGQAARQGQETDALLHRDNDLALYSIEGFILFWFGAVKVSYRWHSCLMLFYYMLLFTVGMALAVLAIVGLLGAPLDTDRKKFYLYSYILSILSGLLFLLAALQGGCMLLWRTSAIPACCTRNISPMGIVAFLLSLAHVGLMAALSSVLILYSYVNTSTSTTYTEPVITEQLQWLYEGETNLIWSLAALVVWALFFLLTLIPACLLFRRKYKPRNNVQG